MELILAQIVIPFIGTVLLGLAGAITTKVRRKIGLDIEDRIVEQAVHYAEEKARNALADSGEKLPGNLKLDAAIAYVWDAIPEARKDACQARLKKKVESAVNRYLRNG